MPSFRPAISDCVVTSEGEVQRCEVTGRLEVRTEGTTTSQVDVSLAEDVRLLEAGAPGEPCEEICVNVLLSADRHYCER